jgi:hypothetical protein
MALRDLVERNLSIDIWLRGIWLKGIWLKGIWLKFIWLKGIDKHLPHQFLVVAHLADRYFAGRHLATYIWKVQAFG